MAIELSLGGYPFVCVPLQQADFSNTQALYAVIRVMESGQWSVIDIGQSGKKENSINSAHRVDSWRRNSVDHGLWVGTYSMPESEYTPKRRDQVESYLRNKCIALLRKKKANGLSFTSKTIPILGSAG